MKKTLVFMGTILLLAGLQWSLADSTPSTGLTSAPAATPVAKAKHRKKKASTTATAQPTASGTPSFSATARPTMAATPKTSGKSTSKPTAVSTPAAVAASDPLLTEGDQAYAAKDYAKAVAAYDQYQKKSGETPEVTKKLLTAKFYEGQALQAEARKELKEKEKTLKMDEESHNLMVYGKRNPSRGAHLVTLSMALLTPQLMGGDIGFTFLAHWNIGLGIGFMGIDPRLKYYFDGDNASFFLGVGYASYNFSASGSFGDSGGSGGSSGKGTVTINGNFLHFTFGPSFQDKDGFFMEMPIDVGVANINYTGVGSGSSGGGSGSSSSSGSYNGPAGTIGFRWGYSI